MRKPVECKCKQVLQVHENGIRSEDHPAQTSALRCDEREGKHQRHRAYEQIPVHGKEGRVFAKRRQLRNDPVPFMRSQFPDDKPEPDCEARKFCDNRGESDAVDFHSENIYEDQVENNICSIDCENNDQWDARVLQPDKPTDQREIRECCRRAPDAYGEILIGETRNLGIGTDKTQGDRADRRLEHKQNAGDCQGDD